LTRLTWKEVKWGWSRECEESFQKLKNKFIIALMLKLPSGSEGFVVYSDALMKGLSCVLM
jgi:hypothetical protein